MISDIELHARFRTWLILRYRSERHEDCHSCVGRNLDFQKKMGVLKLF